MVTFIHTGDIHLDTPFSANFSKQEMQMRRREIMHTFREIVLAAKDKDFLFIAGDLFDGQYVSYETIGFVNRCFSEIPDTRVFISAGNHDPFTSDSVYAKTDWGENVTVFDTEWEYFDFPEKQTRIHGRSFATAHMEKPMLSSVEIAPDWCNLMVLHGELVSNGGESAYNPIEKDALANSRVDYVALGHIHQRSDLDRVDGVYYAYCGIPDGRGFDEEGEKGYYIGEASQGAVHLTWIPSSGRRFWHIPCDITKAKDRYEVQEMILETIRKKGNDEDCFKVVLKGNVRRGMIDVQALRDVLGGYVFYLDVLDETKPDITPEEMARENTLRGDFTVAMMEKIQEMPEEEKELGYLALELVISAMERGQNQ